MEEAGAVGCSHYKRKSKFVTPCCNKIYTCRFCHDENESHAVNRKDVTELVCTNCETRQKVQAECENCHLRFGKYTCLECKLFDDEEKNQYHCDGCGICRIGGRDRFFHCQKCNMCLPIKLKNRHKCVENVSRANCPVCLEDIHTSRIPCHIPECGHLLHRTCFEDLLQAGHYACPTCQTSLLDMTQLWGFLDAEVAATPMPPEYINYRAEILCKDCHKESTVKFHVVGLKCLHCGSYNTCRIKGSLIPGVSGTSGNENQGPAPDEASGASAIVRDTTDGQDSTECTHSDASGTHESGDASDSETMGITETDLELRSGTDLEVADDSDNGDTADEDTSSPVLCNVQPAR
ncbi:RING finger and CHY zinc finger domain-containing protein 1 isoform X2 [Schistocerca americana]|uniref:RING finger and CHY zinc finger domain-containing protein 1 n=1 Tax=Schistocerca serialis cubense TaxID=2023355 RepID=UPI001F4F751C|nr:RING finger and CHY zinc finger domain-containing protein 1 isoform X2 [Schistocerca americana]XP_049814698.1 RING finger and CHY zinc finger domain-containing protein 1 isoform X1 [Schistocerca nitens]XP_049963564.1 RING finger and CHY zinc finger domain-containing protein 1 [Schistocerca serialis cubense]